MSQNQLQRLLILPNEAQNRLEKDSAEHQTLSFLCEAQNILIDELSNSLPEVDMLEKQIKDIDEEIEDVSQSLEESQSILLELIQHPKVDSEAAGKILESILKNVVKSMQSISLSAISNGYPYVPIFDVLNIEQQIFTIIDDLGKKGLFIEPENLAKERSEFGKQHIGKLFDFLNTFKSGA